MSLTPGARLGVYEIVALVGAGGMGEVYHARDARLARDVAIKVIPQAFSADADRLQRFEQEANGRRRGSTIPTSFAVYVSGRVAVTAEGSRFDVGAVRSLFDVRPGGPRNFFDVTPDARFLVNSAPERSDTSPITLVVNCAAELEAVGK